MKAKINQKKFGMALSYAARSVSSKPNIPVLSNVLLEVKDSGINISATNLDMGINMWIPCNVEEEGSTTVSARFIADFISASSGENVEIELKGNMLHVKTNSSEADFLTIDSSEFPVLPEVKGEPLFTINKHDLLISMNKVLFACSTDLSVGKIQLTGCLFNIDKNAQEIEFVGLDSFRLSLRKSKIENLSINDENLEIIVPARFLQELSKVLSDHENVEKLDVFLSENKSQIIFVFDDISFSIRLLEGPYPDYKRILPDDHVFSFEVEKSELDAAIKIVNTFARINIGNKTLMDVNIEKSEISLIANVAEVGNNVTTVAIQKAEGPSDLNTAYNLRYLQDLVNHVTGKFIIFESKGALAASVFKDTADKNFLHLIMPLRRE
ncbi:MAG: DNA polymerase III subunit beta [Candidatus Dojkabacteria bacterium]|nr:MAG: DNA polymerase III subunit beta [Candidatus Dojkabacteria bacterium]